MMRMAQESSVVVVMPTEAPFERVQLPPHPASPTEDEHQAKPETLGSERKRRKTHDIKDEVGDLSKTIITYECRFCKMRFNRAQALGGHMNRHRQERENEQYQNAHQLVSLMAQQQIPRSWTSMASENLNSATGAPAHWARLSTLPPSQPGDVGFSSRPQLPPLISFTTPRLSMPRTSSAPSATIPDSPSTNFYLPSNSSISNLQHLHWNVDASLNALSFPRSASLNALDSLTGAIRDDFLSGMLQPPPRLDSFECQAQFSLHDSFGCQPQISLPGQLPLGGGSQYVTSDVSGMSTRSPEWRTQNQSPSAQANHASPPREYFSD